MSSYRLCSYRKDELPSPTIHGFDLGAVSVQQVEAELTQIMRSNGPDWDEVGPIPRNRSIKSYLIFVTPDTFYAVSRKKIIFETNISSDKNLQNRL